MVGLLYLQISLFFVWKFAKRSHGVFFFGHEPPTITCCNLDLPPQPVTAANEGLGWEFDNPGGDCSWVILVNPSCTFWIL